MRSLVALSFVALPLASALALPGCASCRGGATEEPPPAESAAPSAASAPAPLTGVGGKGKAIEAPLLRGGLRPGHVSAPAVPSASH